MLIAASRWGYTKESLGEETGLAKFQGLSIGPIRLDNVPQIGGLLLVIQREDPRDSVSYSRLILPRVEFRTADKVESGVTRLG
jgi:hypothetical protein